MRTKVFKTITNNDVEDNAISADKIYGGSIGSVDGVYVDYLQLPNDQGTGYVGAVKIIEPYPGAAEHTYISADASGNNYTKRALLVGGTGISAIADPANTKLQTEGNIIANGGTVDADDFTVSGQRAHTEVDDDLATAETTISNNLNPLVSDHSPVITFSGGATGLGAPEFKAKKLIHGKMMLLTFSLRWPVADAFSGTLTGIIIPLLQTINYASGAGWRGEYYTIGSFPTGYIAVDDGATYIIVAFNAPVTTTIGGLIDSMYWQGWIPIE